MIRTDRRLKLYFLQCNHIIRQSEPYVVESRKFDSILVYLDGGHIYRFGGRVESAGVGDIVYVPRGLKYTNYPIKTDQDFYQVEFLIEDDFGHKSLFDDWLSIRSESVEGSTELLIEMYKSFAGTDEFRHLHCHARLTELIKRICTVMNSSRFESERFRQIRRAAGIIAADIASERTVGELAAELSMSVSSLERGFCDCFGCSPTEYRRERRIERAKLLLKSGLSVTETALTVGYSDIYYFSRVFKNSCGIPPSEYARG